MFVPELILDQVKNSSKYIRHSNILMNSNGLLVLQKLSESECGFTVLHIRGWCSNYRKLQ